MYIQFSMPASLPCPNLKYFFPPLRQVSPHPHPQKDSCYVVANLQPNESTFQRKTFDLSILNPPKASPVLYLGVPWVSLALQSCAVPTEQSFGGGPRGAVLNVCAPSRPAPRLVEKSSYHLSRNILIRLLDRSRERNVDVTLDTSSLETSLAAAFGAVWFSLAGRSPLACLIKSIDRRSFRLNSGRPSVRSAMISAAPPSDTRFFLTPLMMQHRVYRVVIPGIPAGTIWVALENSTPFNRGSLDT